MSAQKGSGWSEIWKRLFTIDCRFQRDQDQWGLLLFNYLQSHIAIEPTSCSVSDSLTRNVSNKRTMLLNRPRLCKTEIHPSKLGMPAARTSGIRKRVPFLINFSIVQCLWWIWGNFSALFLRDICGKRAPHLSLSCIPGHWWGKNLNEASDTLWKLINWKSFGSLFLVIFIIVSFLFLSEHFEFEFQDLVRERLEKQAPAGSNDNLLLKHACLHGFGLFD